MENNENRRKKDKYYDADEYRREKRPRRARSRSYSPARERESQRHRERDSRRKRKHSKSRSPDISYKEGKRRNEAPNGDEAKSTIPERKAKDNDMLNTRTGGAYIPPARLRMMQAQITDKASVAYQRLAWEALKKSIHGHINKINVGNIGIIIKELLKENIVRGRGLLCRSVIQAQAASPTFTNVYAALVAAVNSRFPNIGELLLKRLVIQFKRGFKRNDKAICISSASFIAHLVNQRVAHEILALELLTLLVETPTDDSVEVAIAFLKECGQKLTEVSSKGVNAIFEMLRNILHEGQLDKRVQYMIEVMFQVWKDGFKDHPALIEELELVPEEEQFTHLLMLDDAADPQDILNVFKFDDKYEENEQKYKTLSKDILGSDAESEDEDGSGESGSEESADEEEEEKKDMTIIDNTETNLVALRRTIYLTINSSLDFEECAHKLMKMQLKPGQEVELCHMFLDCCAEQRTYEKFYGLLAQRFCNINRIYIGPFEEIFKDSYSTAHRLDTNRLRNVSKFFAHLLFTDSISWEVMECVRLNEEDTTSSSRIYIKILFQELAEYMGLKKLNERLKDPTLQEAFSGLFPRDNPKNTRFSINFFTSIGLGGLTDELREHLKQMPKNVPAAITEIKLDSSSDSSSSSSSSSDDSSSSDSSSSESSGEDNSKKVSKSKKAKEKNKQKPSEPTNKDTIEKSKEPSPERWGHDGFYDTYGQGAKRTNSRPKRSERETMAPERVSRRDYREDDRNGDDNSSRDRRRDNRRDDREKGDYRSSRHQNTDSRRIEHEERRRRERDYDGDRRKQYNDRRNNDDRRRNDNKEIDKSDRDKEKTRRRRSSYEDKRQDRENDNDKRSHRENEENRKNVDPKRNVHNDKEKERHEEHRNNGDDSKSEKKQRNKENEVTNDSKNDKKNTKETTSAEEVVSNKSKSKGNAKKTKKQNDDVNGEGNKSTRKKEVSVNNTDNKKKKKKQPVSSSSSSSSSDSSSSGSSSESSSSEEEPNKKSKKKNSKVNTENDKGKQNVSKKKKNHKKKDKTSEESSSGSDDEEEQKEKKLGGRYWDHFDISGEDGEKIQKHKKSSGKCER